MDITITVTAQQATRISSAVGNRFALGRNATEVEVKQFILNYLKQMVVEQERQVALANVNIEAF